MSKWTRVKIAVITSTAILMAWGFGSCLPGLSWDRVVQLTTIANLFD